MGQCGHADADAHLVDAVTGALRSVLLQTIGAFLIGVNGDALYLTGIPEVCLPPRAGAGRLAGGSATAAQRTDGREGNHLD